MRTRIILVLIAALLIAGLWAAMRAPADNDGMGGNTDKQDDNDRDDQDFAGNNLIHVFAPKPNEIITSPVHIKGEARGNWYFEATFPITIADSVGRNLANTFITAKGGWMTEDFVPFDEQITFASPQTEAAAGTIILHKSNASGLPEHDDRISIPVRFR